MDTSDDSRPGTGRARPLARLAYCDIGARNIPIVMQDRLGHPVDHTLRWFCGDQTGLHEMRAYAFWSVLAGPVSLMVFRVAGDRSIESGLHERGAMTGREAELLQKFADRIMPATAEEVNLWLKSHPNEAGFLVGS